MKKIIALFLGILSTSAIAHAYSADMSWDEINRSKYLHPKAPTVYMGRSIDYMFVCQDGDRLRTQKPVDITETRSYGGDRMEVVVVGREYLSTPIDYVHTVEDCFWNTNQRICKDVDVYGSYPLTVTIPVYKRISNRNVEREELLFRKSYTVPSCNDVVQPH
ncbi:hypothetical protein [Bdellovibrio bacteriovorus]|uniref:Bdellovibrio beta-sandwich domain-containing protein n=1 Tax=Bdellovibrio bacteriovorus TaxID=959 RepID=A0A150WFH8_BDEBC|nr:hypothetical protein [Bdellovibrio bacteriovorus]KYG61799.1 hypothetical protein AZI85_06135 [Bdellovibrio bacteriovorus]